MSIMRERSETIAYHTSINLTPEEKWQLKVLAAKRKIPLKDLIREAVLGELKGEVNIEKEENG